MERIVVAAAKAGAMTALRVNVVAVMLLMLFTPPLAELLLS